MIERANGMIYFSCSVCGEASDDYDDHDDGGFADAWASAKEDGWRAFKDHHGKWQHRCPDCRGQD